MAMEGNRSTAVIVLVVIVALIVGGLLYMSSTGKKQEAEERGKAIDRARMARETETRKAPAEPAEAPEAPAEPAPAEPTPAEAVPAEPVQPSAPAPEPMLPAAVSSAGCKADQQPIIRQRTAAAPEGMVYVPGGVFTMGSAPNVGFADEQPAHSVCVGGFYIDRHEVTNAQFKQFVDATGYVTEAEKDIASASGRTWRYPYGPESGVEETPDLPVACVSWNDALSYARWAGKRLPTEAEWEKAARGTDGRVYPWGNAVPVGASANIADKSAGLKWGTTSVDDNQKMAAPVGSFPAGRSVYGIDDMAGNVWEWCLDWWDDAYYGSSPANNPTGPEAGEFKIIRGGSWYYTVDGARTAQRMYFRPTATSPAIGFRCVKDVS
jgi:formylglycine-generating enzyme required for sulfatase activity